VPFAFSFFYVVMNVGALVAPLTVAALRERIRQPRAFSVGPLTMTMSSSQLMFAIATGATLLSLLLVVWVPEPPDAKTGPRENPFAILKSVVAEKTFWRFMLLVGLLGIVLLAFQHAHMTWPKYTMREFGKDFPWARYWAINPAMVILLTPIVTAITRRFDAFKCLVAGSMVSASSILAMAFSTTITASVVFIVTLSLGEAVWSPRLYEYATVIAPKGREASYMGLTRLPFFLAKPIAGFSSGVLLAHYCPEVGERQSHLMWAILGAATVAAPIAILLFRKVIQPDKGEPEGAPAEVPA
jgi:dipeptide/tripeptide permease